MYSSQSISRLENVNLLGDVISHAHLGSLYYDGNGIGGSFIAEFYQAGIFITIILSILLGLFINYFNVVVSGNRTLVALSFFIVSNVAYMPRSSFFRSPYMILFCFIFYLIMINLPKIKIKN